MAKIFVGTPMYGGNCSAQYLNSMLELQLALSEAGHELCVCTIQNESLITRARNTIAHEYLKTDYDYLLFIDADHRFNSKDILKMIDSDLDILCAVPPKKSINWNVVRIAANHGAENLELYTGDFVFNVGEDDIEVSFDKPFEIVHGGTGLMLISRKVFETIAPSLNEYVAPHGSGVEKITEFFFTEVDNNVLLSEDYAFCKKWAEHGGKTYAAPWVNITHVGTYEFSGSFMAVANLENQIQGI